MKRIDISNFKKDSSFYKQIDLILTVKSFDLQAIRKRYLESKKNKRSGSTQRREPALGGVVSLSIYKGKLFDEEVLTQLKEPRGIDFLHKKLAISSEDKVYVITDDLQTAKKECDMLVLKLAEIYNGQFEKPFHVSQIKKKFKHFKTI